LLAVLAARALVESTRTKHKAIHSPRISTVSRLHAFLVNGDADIGARDLPAGNSQGRGMERDQHRQCKMKDNNFWHFVVSPAAKEVVEVS
jgi:hypothetical protein